MKYDVIVVGAGSAGCAAATRLSEDPSRSVLLLEAGPDYPEMERLPDELKYGHTRDAETRGAAHNWSLRGTINDTQGEIHVAQGRVVGGSGAINGQVLLRGLTQDFDDYAALGNDEWSYVNVLPYYRRMETDQDIRDDFHGSDGPLPVLRRAHDPLAPIQAALRQACIAAGFPETYDMNGPDSTGVGAIPMNNPEGIRMSVALSHLSTARHRLNLTIRGNVLARRVAFEGNRAIGVEVESGGEIYTVEADEIVLCGGGLRSSHLLLLSGVGPAEHLQSLGIPVVRDLPGVGQNLRNHPSVGVQLMAKEGVRLVTDNPGTRIALRYTAEGSPYPNDVMITTSSVFASLSGEVIPDEGFRFSCALELPMSAGELRLSSADPNVQPEFNYHYLEHPLDRERLRSAIRLCVRLLESEPYRDLLATRVAPTDEELASDDLLDAYMLRTVGTARHVSGTCKMGPASDPMAVVDQGLRVHGLEGIRVADPSILPNVVRANTNATAIMIGERVSDLVATG